MFLGKRLPREFNDILSWFQMLLLQIKQSPSSRQGAEKKNKQML